MYKKLILVSALASVLNCVAAEDGLVAPQNVRLSVNEQLKRVPTQNLIKDEFKKTKFLIKFKSVETVSIDPQNIRENGSRLSEYYSEISEPDVIDDKVLRSAEDKIKWASKESIASLHYLSANYKIEAKLVLTVIDKVVSAYLTEEEAEKIAHDDLIDWISPDEIVVASGFGNGGNSDQILTWGFEATNTSVMGSGGTAYVADLTLSNIAMADHPAMTRIHENQSFFLLDESFHPVYVTSIIGAKNNTQQARGISTGSIIHSSILTLSVGGFAEAVEAAYVHAEASGRFSPLNLSVNASNPADFGNHTANLHKWVSIASNRLMIAQSAGNHRGNACSYSYTPQGRLSASPVDGVMVVGAYNNNGSIAADWPDGIGVGFENRYGQWSGGSNSGACVDIWAPGKDIAVSSYLDQAYFSNPQYIELNGIYYNNNSTLLNKGYMIAAGGTSFAAPFVTGIAARLNLSNNIRPPQLESMLRATSSHTGGYDPTTGQAMMGVKYNSNALSYGIKYIKPSISVNQSQGVYLTDGKFDSIAWNAGSNNGEFIFNATPLKLVRFTPRGPGEDGVLNYKIQIMNSSNGAWSNIVSGSTNTYDRVPVTVEIPSGYQSYSSYKIVFNKPNGGWVALSEFETYQ